MVCNHFYFFCHYSSKITFPNLSLIASFTDSDGDVFWLLCCAELYAGGVSR